jgi:hypothetical protein
MSPKNPVTPSGIDPETIRLVAQRLNNCVTPGPLLVKYPSLLSDFNETLFFTTGYRKTHKFHENPSRRSRVDPCGRKEGRTDRATDMAKLIVYFGNVPYFPKNTITYSFIIKEEEGLG